MLFKILLQVSALGLVAIGLLREILKPNVPHSKEAYLPITIMLIVIIFISIPYIHMLIIDYKNFTWADYLKSGLLILNVILGTIYFIRNVPFWHKKDSEV